MKGRTLSSVFPPHVFAVAVAVQIPHDAVALQVEHGVVVSQRCSSQRRAGGPALLPAALVPRRGADRESLCGGDHAVKGVQLWTIDQRCLVLRPEQYLATVLEGVDDHRAGVSEADLEDGRIVPLCKIYLSA